MYKLRPYQIDAIAATLNHFRRDQSPDALALPNWAKGRVFVMAYVRELVEQNHAKFLSFELEAGIYSTGLKCKELVFDNFSLLVIHERYRISLVSETQYLHLITQLQNMRLSVQIFFINGLRNALRSQNLFRAPMFVIP